MTVRRRAWHLLTLALMLPLFCGGEAVALEKCKAKINGKDGTIAVQAKDVQGALKWGNEPGQETNAFSNVATCV